MRHERVKITRDTSTANSRAVAPWEIPILEYIFGEDGNVVRTGEFVEVTPGKLINLDYPEAITEHKRLIDAYGHDPQSGVPYAVSVYGNGSSGVRALAKLIDKARADDKAAAPAAKRSRPAARAADPLLS